MALFSTSDSVSSKRDVVYMEDWTCGETIASAFQVDQCIKWITENNLKRVCLQFPDEALVNSHKVCELIQSSSTANIFILADTSYASCCVDAVAASHVDADAVIHFGAACLTPCSATPVLYVYQPAHLDTQQFCQAIRNANIGDTLVFYETKYHRHLAALREGFDGTNIKMCELDEGSSTSQSVNSVCGRRVPLSSSPTTAIFLGSESLLLTNLTLFIPEANWYLYDGVKLSEHTINTSKFLMKRLHLIEKVKDAAAIGALVGTLSVDGTLQAVDRIKSLCKRSDKKCYTVAVGRPNVPKLANFPEIDVFVLVSCPENQLLIDTSEFFQPIVSLLEVELALAGRVWSPKYSLDFRQLQPGGRLFSEQSEPEQTIPEAEVSLVTGKLRGKKQEAPVNSQALISKVSGTVVESRGAQFLSERSWSGLDQKLGETPVEKAVQGRRGVALGYENEGSSSFRKLRLLCLHGYRQDGPKLRQQTGALRKMLKSIAELEFLSAPFVVPNEGEASRSWWFTKDGSFSSRDDSENCSGFQESIQLLEQTWNASKYDGLFGFSQGACFVSLITALSETGRTSIRPEFVIMVSSFTSLCKAHAQIYPPVIRTASLHVFGETDQVIPCEWSEQLCNLFENATVIKHEGGHFVPGNSTLKPQYYSFLEEQRRRIGI